MKTTTVKKDIIPYRAGVVMLVPLDANKRPDYTKAVRTEYDFLTSTQTSVTHNTETLANGNGQDKEYPLDETYTVTAIGNTYNPVFHATVTGRIETLPSSVLLPDDFTYTLPLSVADGDTLGISFGPGGDHETVPGKDDDGNYNFIINDSYGNTLVRLTKDDSGIMPSLEKGAYYYDPDEKKLMFSDDYLGAAITVTYWYNDENAIQYDSDPIIKTPEYLVQIFGLSQSASSSDTYKIVTTIKRATASGDVVDQTTQKSRSAPITYTFASTPVPSGTSVYSQVLTPVTSEDISTGESTSNNANGVDD